MIWHLIAFALGICVMLVYMRRAKGGILWTLFRSGPSSPLVLLETEDGTELLLKPVENAGQGLWTTEDADYLVTEGSVSSLGGIPVLRATENRAYGIPLKYAVYTRWLQEKKHINDIEELEKAVERGEDLDMRTEFEDKEGKKVVLPGVTYSQFKKFVKHNINPAVIHARIAKRVAELKMGPRLDIKFTTLLGIAIIIIAIGLMIYLARGGIKMPLP
ncbi:MAG: hypothetical protein JRD89_16815 [Deltaproteobacteria bacterium]|nr:hypothetical protein [Deltaproteobacteria bacterium]